MDLLACQPIPFNIANLLPTADYPHSHHDIGYVSARDVIGAKTPMCIAAGKQVPMLTCSGMVGHGQF